MFVNYFRVTTGQSEYMKIPINLFELFSGIICYQCFTPFTNLITFKKSIEPIFNYNSFGRQNICSGVDSFDT